MVSLFDRFWIALGLDAEELSAVPWRRSAYALLLPLLGLDSLLALALIANWAR